MIKIDKTYPQAPIEPITEQRYIDMVSKIKDTDSPNHSGGTLEAYYGCSNEHCSLK